MGKSIFGSGGGGRIVSITQTPIPQPQPQYQPQQHPQPQPQYQPIPKKTSDSNDVEHLRFPGYVTKAGSSTTKLTQAQGQGQGQGQGVSQIPYTKSYNIPQTYEAQLTEKTRQYNLIIEQLQSAKTVEDITRIKTVLSKLTSEIQLLKEKYKK